MAAGTGFICLWVKDDIGGIIHVCTGDNLVGEDVAFLFRSCNTNLQSVLSIGSIGEITNCPPPTGSLKVKFDFDFINGMDLAVNVRQ